MKKSTPIRLSNFRKQLQCAGIGVILAQILLLLFLLLSSLTLTEAGEVTTQTNQVVAFWNVGWLVAVVLFPQTVLIAVFFTIVSCWLHSTKENIVSRGLLVLKSSMITPPLLIILMVVEYLFFLPFVLFW